MPYQLPPPKRGRWVSRWSVESDDNDHEYTVSVDASGEYGCSCPRWKFKREQCKHIALLEFWLARGDRAATDPIVRFANGEYTPAATIPAATERLIDANELTD